MLAQVLQIFLGKEHLVKNLLISNQDKLINFEGTIFQGSTKPLFTHNIGWRSAEKNSPVFSNMLLLA
jgi:hypothetical protein